MDTLLTAEELSMKLKISQATIYRWTHEQYIPHVKMGRTVRFNEKAVAEWLKKQEQKGRSNLVPETYL